MLTRRRLMVDDNLPVTDGLLFWFDGKNNLQGGGFSQNTSYWYPIMCVPELNGKYLNKNQYASWLPNGGITANNTSSWAYTSTTLFSYLSDVYDVTFILTMAAPNSGETRFIGEFVSGNYRGVFSIGSWPEEDRYISGWKYWQIKSANNNLPNKNVTFVTQTDTSENTYLHIYRDDVNLGYVKKLKYKRPKGASFVLGGYDVNNGTGNLKGALYSCICYNRALSETEVNKLLKYTNKRYGL